ncbi:long-chain fatty acid--CoA ligase [Rhodococcus erythropolis]|uniref:long-chain fatty acid--CoA ligase n=1 Tax=Rhodococcus erythropolis TaxID=1833 RepID=UPI00294A1F51|nr:long-chain fatty acid--CoA ligase [Rhodococcus erythropolis]MDV6212813.1 long-chain fatty acid--CoA ligase [Rhodococcus erythropolis]
MKSTMQDAQLTVGRILTHAVAVHPTSEVLTATENGLRSATFAEVGERATRLAAALRGLGIDGDQRIGTFLWNTQEHLEAYVGVPAMGAVLHTINIRISNEQLVYVVNHAEDKIVLVQDTLLDILGPVLDQMKTVEHVVVVGPDAAVAIAGLAPRHFQAHEYEGLLSAAASTFEWPEVNERDAAVLCYTSGTTGDPKGVAYSHRSVYLHAMACSMADGFDIGGNDRVLPVVPMFHANAWGMPYTAMMVGAALVLPDRFMQSDQLVRLVERSHATIAGGVPTIWSDMVARVRTHGGDLSSLRVVFGGGSAVAVGLQRAMRDVCGVYMLQAWGMTETSPTALVSWPPYPEDHPAHWALRAKQGRLMNLVEARIVDDAGVELSRDGRAIGEIEVRGPYVTGSYYRVEAPDRFDDGWLRTGDLGTIDEIGFVSISDRAKDMIKSGGEWISSVDLESAIVGHPAVREAAVIAIPDPRWEERPMGVVALVDGATASPDELRGHLATQFAKWQVPDAWTFVDQVPRTSVGKYDKKRLRQMHADGAFGPDSDVVISAEESPAPDRDRA